MTTWQVQQAKTHFSELLERAEKDGPQTITKHGKVKAVILAAEDYDAMKSGRPKPNLIDYLLNEGPKFEEGFEIERDKDTGREIDLE